MIELALVSDILSQMYPSPITPITVVNCFICMYFHHEVKFWLINYSYREYDLYFENA